MWVHSWYETKDELMERIRKGDDSGPTLPDFDSLLESDTLLKLGHSGRVLAEESFKLKDMREELFGYYSETIPKADSSRYPSVPLQVSTAKVTLDNQVGEDHHWYHVPGQKLQGTMIQRRARQEKAASEAVVKVMESKKSQ
jgi:hypothetical protein